MNRNLHSTQALNNGHPFELTNIPPYRRAETRLQDERKQFANRGYEKRERSQVHAHVEAHFKAARLALKKRLNRQIEELLDGGLTDEFTLKWALMLFAAPEGTTVTLRNRHDIEVQLGKDVPA